LLVGKGHFNLIGEYPDGSLRDRHIPAVKSLAGLKIHIDLVSLNENRLIAIIRPARG
jgi:hypothetical protein